MLLCLVFGFLSFCAFFAGFVGFASSTSGAQETSAVLMLLLGAAFFGLMLLCMISSEQLHQSWRLKELIKELRERDTQKQ